MILPLGTSRLTDYRWQTHRERTTQSECHTKDRKDAVLYPCKLLPRTSVPSCGFFFPACVHLRFLNLPSVGRLAFPRSSESGVINRRILELTSPVVSFLYGSLGRVRVSGCYAGIGGNLQDSPGDDRVRCVVGGFQEITELTFRGPVPQ
jgi:hypothetical protein